MQITIITATYECVATVGVLHGDDVFADPGVLARVAALAPAEKRGPYAPDADQQYLEG